MARLLDIIATGICGVLNLSAPSFGPAPARNPGYYFFVAGGALSRAFSIAKHEAENQSSGQNAPARRLGHLHGLDALRDGPDLVDLSGGEKGENTPPSRG